VSLKKVEIQNMPFQGKKQICKQHGKVHLTGELSMGCHIGGPGIGCLSICGTEHGLGRRKALL
jgi:hypothetical protein